MILGAIICLVKLFVFAWLKFWDKLINKLLSKLLMRFFLPSRQQLVSPTLVVIGNVVALSPLPQHVPCCSSPVSPAWKTTRPYVVCVENDHRAWVGTRITMVLAKPCLDIRPTIQRWNNYSFPYYCLSLQILFQFHYFC